MVITRFNPTANGLLHLGHIFTLLVNEYYAHSHNGSFFIRFDDDISLIRLQPEEIKRIIEVQIEDINWLEIIVDRWIWQSEILPEARDKLKSLEYEAMPEIKFKQHKYPFCIRMGTDFVSYPYVVQQTVERVVMDNMLGITHLIRGDDFISEYSLYCYFCQRFGFPIPEFVFLPRLASSCGEISKTNGGYKIADFRNSGYTAEQLKTMIAKACLWYPNNGFELYNIKPNPRINM